jgi:hypothetical protein
MEAVTNANMEYLSKIIGTSEFKNNLNGIIMPLLGKNFRTYIKEVSTSKSTNSIFYKEHKLINYK